MANNSLEAELHLLAECVSFATKWLCWRKWLRVHGILAWSLNGLQIKTDEGQIAPVYRYEASWKKYFASLAMQRNVTFTHFSAHHRRQNITGGALQALMMREQRIWAIEHEWCRLNSDTLFKHPFFNSPGQVEKNERPGGETTRMPGTFADSYIDNPAMVDFYQRLCGRLAELIGGKSRRITSMTTPFAKKYPVPVGDEGEKAAVPTWQLDGMLRTFDDATVLLMMEMMSHCVVEHVPADDKKAALMQDHHGLPFFSSTGNEKRWLTIAVKQKNEIASVPMLVAINLNDCTKVIWQTPWPFANNNKALAVSAPPLPLLRALLNQHLLPETSLYFQSDATVGKTIAYGNVLLNLMGESRQIEARAVAEDTDAGAAVLAYPRELHELLKMIQLKNIARFLLCYSNGNDSNGRVMAHDEADHSGHFFPNNGVEWFSPLTEAIWLLADNPPGKEIASTIDMNTCTIDDKVRIGDDMTMSSAIAAYQQYLSSSRTAASPKQNQLFSLRVTSLLFDRKTIQLCAKRLENNSTHARLNTESGFYLRHANYQNVIMVFIPSNAVPQCDRQLKFDDKMAILLGDRDDAINTSLQESAFLRLVLVRAETTNKTPLGVNFDTPINLDDPFILCMLLKDIAEYFDPLGQRTDQLFRVDPFLSMHVDTDNTLVYWLDEVKINHQQDNRQKSTQKTILNGALWPILRDLSAPKSALVRSSPVCYGPELHSYGITQQNKGIVPFEMHTAGDTWKLYVYDDPALPVFLNDGQLMQLTTWVCTRDHVDNHWLIAQDKRLAKQAITQEPVVVRLINWYGDHYPTGKPTIKKIIAKRIYLINDVIAFCENPTKLVWDEKFKVEKAEKIHDWHFANYGLVEKNNPGQPASPSHFSEVVYNAMRENNINYRIKRNTVRLSFYETPFFFVMFFQCTYFWFPKWPGAADMCYDDVPQTLVPLIQWAIDKAIITTE